MVRYAEGQNFGSAGVKIEEQFKSVEEVMKDSNLDYNVSLRDCYVKSGETEIKVPKTKVTVRDDNDSILGVVGERYKTLQNSEAFSWFQEFIDNKVASIEHAGNLGRSGIVFVQAKVNVDPIEIIKGDAVESRITLLNSFDGSTSVFAGFFPTRLFCANQLPKLKTSNMLKIKHTKNLHIGLEKIRKIMDVHNQEFVATCEQYRFLASKGVNKTSLEKYVRIVLGNENEENEKELRVSRIDTICDLFENGRGASENTKNYFGAFNAVNEFLNWESGRSVDSRLKSLWTGANSLTNQKALEVATKLAMEN